MSLNLELRHLNQSLLLTYFAQTDCMLVSVYKRELNTVLVYYHLMISEILYLQCSIIINYITLTENYPQL